MNVKQNRAIASILATSLLAGCAVPQQAVDMQLEAAKKTMVDMTSQQTARPADPLVKRVKGTYLTSAPIALAYDATLPAIFRDVTLQFPGKANLATAASRITQATRIPVRIREDVYYAPKTLAAGGLSDRGGNTTPMVLPPPLPGDVLGVKALANTDGIVSQKTDDFDLSMSMEFKGSLSNYLDTMCNRIGVNWEYRDGTIYIYRLVTKAFLVNVNPGAVEFNSTLAKGGSTSTGASGGASTSSGSFNSQSGTTMNGKFSVWESLEAAVRGMLSPLGKLTVAQSSGKIIVTDTKEVLNDVGRLISSENATLTRQVEVDVRILRVSVNKNSTSDLNVNLAYSRLLNGAKDWSLEGTAPGSLASSSSLLPGGLGARVLNATSKFSGSTVFVNALNQIGKIVSDETVTAITTNRMPVPVGKFSTVTYLAETKPAASGGTGSGAGVPGLTPGQVTTGFFLNVIPTVLDNNSVLMRLSLDQSSLTKMGSITTGSGETQQMIQTPNTDGDKSDHSVGLREGESLVLMGISKNLASYDNAYAPTGLSNVGNKTDEMQVIIVTPRVRPGI